MADAPLSPSEERHAAEPSGSRSWIVVTAVAALLLGALTASVGSSGVRLNSQTTQSGVLGDVNQILYYGQSQAPPNGFVKNFNVPASSGMNVPVKVGEVALMGIDCGVSAVLIGDVDNCTIQLATNPSGDAPVETLWTETFTGYAASDASLLAPGNYTLTIHVHAGFAPEAVIAVSFSVIAEIATLN
jgi:hypothetical protein